MFLNWTVLVDNLSSEGITYLLRKCWTELWKKHPTWVVPLRWKNILLFGWQTVKKTLSGTILFKTLWKTYLELTGLEKVPFHSDCRTHMLTHSSTEPPRPTPQAPLPPLPPPWSRLSLLKQIYTRSKITWTSIWSTTLLSELEILHRLKRLLWQSKTYLY